MIERTIFECEHCHKKRLINKTQMKKHEEICWYNSKNKTCLTCKNYEYEAAYQEPHYELEGCPMEEVPSFKYCNLKDKYLEIAPETNCTGWIIKEEV